MAMPVDIDPLRNVLSDVSETKHLSGDDDGRHLTDSVMRDFNSLGLGAASPSGKETALTEPMTLGDMPFVLLHLEMDDKGYPVQIETGSPAHDWVSISGRLEEYFTNRTETPEWRHATNPLCFQEDFPFSVDNVNCDKIAADMVDLFNLSKGTGHYSAMWAGVMTRDDNGDLLDKELCRQRILGVSDMLRFLGCVRRLVLNPMGMARHPTVYFLVTVSYSVEKRPPMEKETHDVVRRLHTKPDRNAPPSPDSPASTVLSFRQHPKVDLENWGSMTPSQRLQAYKSYIPQNWTDNRDPEVIDWPFADVLSDDDMSSCSLDDIPDDLLYTDNESEQEDGEVEAKAETEVVVEEPAAPPPPKSILETLDTNAAKGDAMEGDLHALLPDAQPPSDEEWRECCALLCLNPEEHKDAKVRSIKIPGADKLEVKPSQLWTAYWMLSSRTHRDLCGGVLADVMGTGKTYICLLVCILRAYIGYNRAEVEREWQLRGHEGKKASGSGAAPKQHLPRPSAGDKTNTPCTCGNAMGIECYANPGGITRRLADGFARGASLVQVSATLIDNWVKTIKKMQLQPKYFEPVVFNNKMAKEDVAMVPAPRLKQKLQVDVRPNTGTDELFPANWEPNVLETAYSYTPSVAKDAYPERFIFLVGHMPNRLVDFFQVPVPMKRKPGAGTSRERKTVYGCPIGIQFVDEFHKAKDGVLSLARNHKHMRDGGRHFDFWAITGTPMPSKITDLEPVVDLVQRLPDWDHPDHHHHRSRVTDLQALQTAYERSVAEDGTHEQVMDFRDRATHFFGTGLVTRNTEKSTIFGQEIFSLQDVTPKTVVHKTPEALRENVSRVAAEVGARVREALGATSETPSAAVNWDQAIRSCALFSHMMNLEILSTFPNAAPLMLANPPVLDFSLAGIRAELIKTKSRDPVDVPLFQQHLDTMIQGSAHVETVLATMDAMVKDKQRRRLPAPEPTGPAGGLPPRKVDASLKKAVVLCPRFGEAVFMYLALRKLRPELHAAFLHADLKSSERAAMIKNFDRLDMSVGSTMPRVLVGTFRDVGTGNDLLVASYQVLTGPLRLHSQQDQAFGRTNREGQTLRLHHKLLVTDDSPVDRLVMATQAGRRILSDPFNMDEELQLETTEKTETTETN